MNTITPYDGIQLIGSIGGSPVVANQGVISAPSYSANLSGSAALSAASGGCTSSYGSGSGVGCSGYVLTVQSVAGPNGSKVTLQPGMTLYGGAGLLQGTTVTQQISDAQGNLCAESCDAGGAGVYFVDTQQLVAPGTPMSASNGTGFVLGLQNGSMQWWNSPIQGTTSLTPGALTASSCSLGQSGNCWVQLKGNGWSSAVNAVIPWRDGLVAGLNDGSVQYWSPQTQEYPFSGPSQYTTSTASDTRFGGTAQLLAPVTEEFRDLGSEELTYYNAVTAMMPMGDGFVIGATAANPSSNGSISYFTGFGPASSTNAFGYYTAPYEIPSPSGGSMIQAGAPVLITGGSQVGSSGPVQYLNENQPFYSWTTIANSTDLGDGGPNGSVQQLIPWNSYTTDSSGNPVLAQSVIAGLTDNGIWAWTGSTQNPLNAPSVSGQPGAPSATPWIEIQQNNNGEAPTLNSTQLDAAWAYAYNVWLQKSQSQCSESSSGGGASCSGQLPAFGTTGGIGAPGTGGDPIFGLPTNWAYCGSDCASYGDYNTFVTVHPFGPPNPSNPGVIYTAGDGFLGLSQTLPCNTALCNSQLPYKTPNSSDGGGSTGDSDGGIELQPVNGAASAAVLAAATGGSGSAGTESGSTNSGDNNSGGNSSGGSGVQLNLKAELLTYGYYFEPSSTFDKFDPSQWAFGALVAGLAGPQVVMTSNEFRLALGGTQAPYIPLGSYTVPGDGWSANLNAGVQVNAGITGELGLPAQNCSQQSAAQCQPFEFAHAYLVPGLLMTYNTAGYSGLGVAHSMALDANVATPSQILGTLEQVSAQLSAGLDPQAAVTFGLGYPTFPIVDLSLGYQNPVTATVTINCNLDGTCYNQNNTEQIAGPQVSVNSTGLFDYGFALLPKIGGGLLNVSSADTIYSVTDCFVNCTAVGTTGGSAGAAAAVAAGSGPTGANVSAGAAVAAGREVRRMVGTSV